MASTNKNESKLSSFLVRLMSSAIILVVTIGVLIPGGDILFAAILTISLIGMYELYKIVNIHKSILGFVGYLSNTIWFVLIRTNHKDMGIMLMMITIMLMMAVYVFLTPRYQDSHVSLAVLGIIYVGVMLSFIYQTRCLDDGIWIIWLVFVGSWGSDTCAYCTGILIGKHKLAPKVSPGKSIEGSIGGIVGAALLGVVYAVIVGNRLNGISNPIIAFSIMGSASSVISQIGDLAASAIKRNHNVKDYGNLIPGHGGIMDRFDSVFFTAPIVYFLSYYVFM